MVGYHPHELWGFPEKQPEPIPGHEFIAAAFCRLGRLRYGEEWSDEDVLAYREEAPPSSFREADDATRSSAAVYLMSRDANYVPQRAEEEEARAPVPVTGFAALGGGWPSPVVPMRLQFLPEEWDLFRAWHHANQEAKGPALDRAIVIARSLRDAIFESDAR